MQGTKSGANGHRGLPSTNATLERQLVDRPTDEKAGAHASLGFTYQQWWGALVVTELLGTSSNDFAVAMEVKEDVALLDSFSKPTTVEFCQIKKNEQAGGWSLKDLHGPGPKRRDGSRDLSPLAKLYRRRQEFSGCPAKLRFVSNLSVKVSTGAGSQSSVDDCQLAELTTDELTKLSGDLSAQVSIDASSLDLSDFTLHRTNLPLGEQYLFVAGKLSELYYKGFLPFEVKQPTVAARVLASELQSKASSTSYAKTFAELAPRMMSRAEAIQLLAEVSNAVPGAGDLLDEAIQRLELELHDFDELKAIKRSRVMVLAHAVDRTNALFKRVASTLAECSAQNPSSSDGKLGTLMRATLASARKIDPSSFIDLSNGYSCCITLLVLNDAINIDVLHIAACSQPEAKQ